MDSQDKIWTPELLRIFKIFGLTSVAIVLLLSFFNERKANNTGEVSPTHMNASNHIYFKNVRQISYDLERLHDAKMEIFRLKKQKNREEKLLLNLLIIISRIKDEAYIFVEPSDDLAQESPLSIRWHREGGAAPGEFTFYAGNRLTHLQFVKTLYPLLEEEEMEFEVQVNGEWERILGSSEAREAFSTTAFDYFRLIQ